MKERVQKFIDNIFDSFSNSSVGYSGKKLSAFAIISCVIAAHIKWLSLGDFSQLIPVLATDYSFVAVLFGINTYDKKVNSISSEK